MVYFGKWATRETCFWKSVMLMTSPRTIETTKFYENSAGGVFDMYLIVWWKNNPKITKIHIPGPSGAQRCIQFIAFWEGVSALFKGAWPNFHKLRPNSIGSSFRKKYQNRPISNTFGENRFQKSHFVFLREPRPLLTTPKKIPLMIGSQKFLGFVHQGWALFMGKNFIKIWRPRVPSFVIHPWITTDRNVHSAACM